MFRLAAAEDVICRFVALANGRTFVSFEELERALGVGTESLLALKLTFEAELRRYEPDVRLTSRLDLRPPGFEISD